MVVYRFQRWPRDIYNIIITLGYEDLGIIPRLGIIKKYYVHEVSNDMISWLQIYLLIDKILVGALVTGEFILDFQEVVKMLTRQW